MQARAKRDAERWVLESVYDPAEFEVEHCDSPDFVLARPGSRPFGVEVTEVFRDESEARILSVPGYMSSLLAGGSHIHRDDIKKLEVAHLEIHDADGNLKRENLPGLIRESPSKFEHYERVAAAIERKNKAHAAYDRSTSHINLVIGDHFPIASTTDGNFSTSEILVPRLREALRLTPFRGVHLVSHIGYGDAAVYELDMLWLWEGFMIFLAAVDGTYGATAALNEEDVSILYAAAMRKRGWPVRLVRESDRPFAAAGNFSVALVPDRGIVIHDRNDWPLGPLIEPAPPRGASDIQARVLRRFHAMLFEFRLVTSFSKPAKRVASG